MIRDLNLLPLAPEGLNVAAPGVTRNFTEQARSGIDETEVSSASREDSFVVDDTFPDQGPGSVEVYTLDVHRENSLLVSDAVNHDVASNSSEKNKIANKALSEEIQRKLGPIKPSKKSLPSIVRDLSVLRRGILRAQKSRRQMNANRKDETFASGGVTEMQIGGEGLETLKRRIRSSGPGDGNSMEDPNNWKRIMGLAYRESDLDDFGVNMDPEYYQNLPTHYDYPQRGDLGPLGPNREKSMYSKDSQSTRGNELTFQRDTESGSADYEDLDVLTKFKRVKGTNFLELDPAFKDYFSNNVDVYEYPQRGDLGPRGPRRERPINWKDAQSSEGNMPRFKRETGTSVEYYGGKDDPVWRNKATGVLIVNPAFQYLYDNNYTTAHYPQRGDLGRLAPRKQKSINSKGSQNSICDKARFRRETNISVSSPDSGVDVYDISLPIIERTSGSLGHPDGRSFGL